MSDEAPMTGMPRVDLQSVPVTAMQPAFTAIVPKMFGRLRVGLQCQLTDQAFLLETRAGVTATIGLNEGNVLQGGDGYVFEWPCSPSASYSVTTGQSQTLDHLTVEEVYT